MEEIIKNLEERLKEDPEFFIEIPVTVMRISEEEANELRKQMDEHDEEQDCD